MGLPSIFQQPLPTWAYATIQRVGALNGTPRQGLEVCFKRHPPRVIPTNNAGDADGHSSSKSVGLSAPASKPSEGLVEGRAVAERVG